MASGVWVFKNGVVRTEGNPEDYQRKKRLIHVPSKEVIESYDILETKLLEHGWERYSDDPELLQFQKKSTDDLIALPNDFNKFSSVHMYDIVLKNRNVFEVRDMVVKVV